MKKILFAILLAVIALGVMSCGSSKDQVSTDAQPKKERKRGGDREEKMNELISKLYLIGAQEDQFRAIQEKYEPKMEKAMRERNMDSMKALRDQQLAEIKSILSDTQYAAFEEEMQRQVREQRAAAPTPK